MKPYVRTVAAAFVPALVRTATASADDGLTPPGQSGTQVADLRDQSGGEQKKDADVTQKQGDGDVAKSDVDQENGVDQSQVAYQRQTLVQRCCAGLINR